MLGNSRTTASTLLSQDTTLNDSTTEGYEVNTRMLIIAHILSCHKCLHHVRRNLIEGYMHTILSVLVPCAYHLTVSTIYLGGISVDRILQIFHIRHIAYPSIPYHGEQNKHQEYSCCYHFPKKKYEFPSHFK